MEKTKEIIREIKNIEHSFYCDECEKYLGTSQEYDDGWYKEFGELELRFYVYGQWYKIKKCLCNDCKINFINNIKANLINLGFEKD